MSWQVRIFLLGPAMPARGRAGGLWRDYGTNEDYGQAHPLPERHGSGPLSSHFREGSSWPQLPKIERSASVNMNNALAPKATMIDTPMTKPTACTARSIRSAFLSRLSAASLACFGTWICRRCKLLLRTRNPLRQRCLAFGALDSDRGQGT